VVRIDRNVALSPRPAIKGEALSFAESMQIEERIDDLFLPDTVDLSQYERLANLDPIISSVIYNMPNRFEKVIQQASTFAI
jgi:hypothetical protein